jgi:hypothetical protein
MVFGDKMELKDHTTKLTFEDALRIARGCTDYGGGYRGTEEYEVYQHGIQTVINALTAAQNTGVSDSQIKALHMMGKL